MEAVDSRKRKFDEMEEQQAVDEADQLSRPLSVIYPQTYPWLVISQGEDFENQTFVDVCHPVVDSQYSSNIPKSQCFTRRIPEMHNKVVCATRNQWLVLKDESMSVSLLNLITKEVVPLPMMAHCTINDICLLSSAPTDSTDDCYVFFIHRATFEFFYCKPGDRDFKKQLFESKRVTQIAAATVFGGSIYFMSKLDAAPEMHGHPHIYALFSAQIVGTNLQFTEITRNDFLKPSGDHLTEDYLVDSDNELLYIVKMSMEENPNSVFHFLIFRMDFSTREWVPVHDLGERTVFFSVFAGLNNSAICCVAAKEGIKPNAIYFLKHFDNYVHIFDLKSGRFFKELLPRPIDEDEEDAAQLEWVMIPITSPETV